MELLGLRMMEVLESRWVCVLMESLERMGFLKL